MADKSELAFFFKRMAVGYFLDATAYPNAPGSYRYMPYRGLGHYEMGEELRRTGSASCTYPTEAGEVEFVIRGRPEYGVLVIDQCSVQRSCEGE